MAGIQYLVNISGKILKFVLWSWDDYISPYLLILMIVVPFVYFFILLIADTKYLWFLAFSGFVIQLLIFLLIFSSFDAGFFGYQFCYWFNILSFVDLNFVYIIGIDGVSIFFVFLVPFLLLLSLCSLDFEVLRLRELLLVFYLIDFTLLNAFTVLDFAFFFFFIEFSVIPMFFLIGIWGSRTRRIVSSYTYYFFSLLASISMLLSIVYLYRVYGTTSLLFYNSDEFDKALQIVCNETNFEQYELTEQLVWFGIFFSLAVKMPLYPFHIWLPEAHGEASTAGSVILAGLFLKMAGYGLIRFLIPIFPNSSLYFQPYIFVVCLMGILYCALILFRQFDLKKFIAYSSVIHMNLTAIALFSPSSLALQGALFSMLTHSIVASFLFFSVGILYERFHSRLVVYYSDLVERMPNFCIFFFTALAANCAFPFTISFVSELMLFLGIGEFSIMVLIISVLGMGLTGVAHYFLINKLIYSHKNIEYAYDLWFKKIDIGAKELLYMLPLIVLTIGLTFFANFIIDEFSTSVTNISSMRTSRLVID